ncbi:MAG: sigma-70 family RNA polymerase sigma factor [Candidatus Glassbacteria bacterium]
MSPELEQSQAYDEQLVELASRGDQTAFRQLYDRYHLKIFRLVGSMVGSPDDAWDIVQEAFVRAFRSLKSFKGQSSFYTWLYRIAVNTTTDFRRKQARRRQNRPTQSLSDLEAAGRQIAAPEGEAPDSALYRKELAELVRRALDTLSEEHRQVMVLREINGLSYGEIAEVTGASPGTVMSRLHYARRKVAEVLRRWNVPGPEGQ